MKILCLNEVTKVVGGVNQFFYYPIHFQSIAHHASIGHFLLWPQCLMMTFIEHAKLGAGALASIVVTLAIAIDRYILRQF